jgi:hypothetical protein
MLARYRKSLVGLIQSLHILSKEKLTNRSLALDIQETLIRQISALEYRIRKAKVKIKESKELLAKRQSKEVAVQLKNCIKHSQYIIYEFQRIISIYRDIGDGLAFIYIDRWDIKPMVFKEAAGSISKKAGSRLERKILRESFRCGHLAILNDITHSLRYGDLTVPNLTGQFLLIEVKRGKHSTKRVHRQKAQSERLMNYLTNDKAVGLYEPDQEMRRVSFETEERHWRSTLNQAINVATLEGSSITKIEEGLYCVVEIDSTINALTKCLSMLNEPTIVTFLNLFKGEVQGYYPFLLTIEDPTATMRFYEGELLITVLLCPSVIKDALRVKGFSCDFNTDQIWILEIGDLNDPSKPNFKVSSHFFNRIAAEFISLEWFIASLLERLHYWKDPNFNEQHMMR